MRCLFEDGTYSRAALYFFYIFIQRYTFYLLIFLWTDTKLTDNKSRIRREIHAVKKPESDDNESENISGKSIGGAALINFFAPDVALI